jgi:hypothetical protein
MRQDAATGRWFLDVTLRGRGTDAEDGTLPDSALIWSAIGPDGVRRSLGSGRTITAALASVQPFSTPYTIVLQVRDSAGNVAETSIRVTVQILS